uniref:MARVEL domain-containing protein n=1 Tax=Panagrellus redivivus TaxID=6233 RepID=A0A7E4UMM5_PANRE
MERLRNFLARKGDQASVSYSRFGGPGEVDEERPPPTSIMIAEFNPNAKEFHIAGCWHVEKAATTVAAFGLSMVILFFISTFFEFDWYHHERGVDVSALLGLFVYLFLGVMVHYYVFYGIRKQKALYLLPFIVVYSVMLVGELIALFGLLIKITQPRSMYDPPYTGLLVSVIVIMAVQAFMLDVINKCRHFLTYKETHEMEKRVAERSKATNPQLEIIVVGANTPIPPAANGGNAADSAASSDHVPTGPTIQSAENPVYTG